MDFKGDIKQGYRYTYNLVGVPQLLSFLSKGCTKITHAVDVSQVQLNMMYIIYVYCTLHIKNCT